VIVSDQLVTALATAAFPTFAVLIGILVNNSRLNDFARAVDSRFADSARSIDARFADTNRHIDGVRDVLRAEMFRMEQVIDARLKHLEEHLQR
jgi:hypothetical protein